MGAVNAGTGVAAAAEPHRAARRAHYDLRISHVVFVTNESR